MAFVRFADRETLERAYEILAGIGKPFTYLSGARNDESIDAVAGREIRREGIKPNPMLVVHESALKKLDEAGVEYQPIERSGVDEYLSPQGRAYLEFLENDRQHLAYGRRR